jgi:transcription elongation factor Elf1
MYGNKRYRQLKKIVEQPVDSSAPTFVCPHCKRVKTLNIPHIEITALENNEIFLYTRMCQCCAELLKAWVKG